MIVQQKLFKVLVIGDVCIDQYFKCRISRLNPESSAPLVNIISTNVKDGMAANVNKCLTNLDIETDTVFSDSQERKVRYVNSVTNEQLLRVDYPSKVDPIDLKYLTQRIALTKYSAIVISDYNKGFLDYDAINYIPKIYNGPIFLDTKKNKLDIFDPRIQLKINEHEANEANVVPSNTIVTMGSYGVIWNGKRWKAHRTELVDVCGAGDAFFAGLVYGYLYDKPNMIDYALVNASISIRHIGTYQPTIKELFNELINKYKETLN